MLGLKLPTDPRWAHLAEANLEQILIDHAFCEQKAASNAITIILVAYPELSDLVSKLIEIAQEELTHFEQVHQHILKRGWKLGFEKKDDYVNELFKFVRTGYDRQIRLIDKLLFSAMIEARSCERFKMLSQKVQDTELRDFYHELMISEANHYTTFLKLAKQYCPPDAVEKRWEEFLAFEASIINKYDKATAFHA